MSQDSCVGLEKAIGGTQLCLGLALSALSLCTAGFGEIYHCFSVSARILEA